MVEMEGVHENGNEENLLKSVATSGEFETHTENIFRVSDKGVGIIRPPLVAKVLTILRLNFMAPTKWDVGKTVNAVFTTIMLCLACYSLIFTTHLTFSGNHSPMVTSSKLLLIGWAVQAIVSSTFLIYWQLCGSLQSFHRQVVECQDGKGLSDGNRKLRQNVVWFNVIIFMEVSIISLYIISYYVESNQAEFVIKQSKMFYFPQLRIVNSFVTLYTYIAWNVSMFIYIMYTDAAYLEVKHYNDKLEKLDGSSSNVESTLLSEMDVYGKICDVVRELDAIFRLYAFIMLAVIIPSVIFTLMMLNQRIHGFKDLIICLPSIALCIYSFLAVTLAPARLHDEVSRSRICLIRNESIWFPYRKDVFVIAQALLSHMQQHDLGMSIWGFAILSRPLILATFSVMAMMLSIIIELTPPLPHRVEVINCTTAAVI